MAAGRPSSGTRAALEVARVGMHVLFSSASPEPPAGIRGKHAKRRLFYRRRINQTRPGNGRPVSSLPLAFSCAALPRRGIWPADALPSGFPDAVSCRRVRGLFLPGTGGLSPMRSGPLAAAGYPQATGPRTPAPAAGAAGNAQRAKRARKWRLAAATVRCCARWICSAVPGVALLGLRLARCLAAQRSGGCRVNRRGHRSLALLQKH